MNIHETVKTWDPVLSKGPRFKNEKIRRATALMLQNQINYLAESNQLNPQAFLNESNVTDVSLNRLGGYANSGDFHKIAIPMVRRTFPELIAHEIVGVQPLAGPVGIAFALRFKATQAYNAPQVSPNHTPDNELGYNNIDPGYSGTNPAYDAEALAFDPTGNTPSGDDLYGNGMQTHGMRTKEAEALGSINDPNLATAPTAFKGLGIGSGATAKEVGLSIEKRQVEAVTRKLRSR